MKRFIYNLLVYVIILSMIMVALNLIYGRSHNTNPDTNKFIHMPDVIQICNFGTSHSMRAFNYGDFKSDYDCFNFALTAQRLSYDYRIFQYYGDHVVEGSVVFIGISYISLFGPDEVDDDGFAIKNERYYSILPAPLIKEYDLKTDLCVRFFPALVTSTSDLIVALLGQSEATYNKSWQTTATTEDIRKSAVERANAQAGNKEQYYDRDGNRIENQKEIDALYALIRGCQEKGAIPILITTPFLQEFTDAVKESAPDFYDHFYSIMDQVVQDTGVEYYDYAFDERFTHKYSWFSDADHINMEGARNFTNILMEEVVYANGYLDK